MTTHLVTVRDTATVAEALDEIRRQAEEVEDFYQVFVVDGDRRLVGILPFKDLVVAGPSGGSASSWAAPTSRSRPELDQEEVARLMARYNLPSVAVVDDSGRLLGRVTFDDVIDVVEAETTEDLLKFGGVSPDEELAAGWTEAVRSRLPWLYVNLLTAFLAGGVVYFFRGTVQRTVALAVWMPIIAGMGGNAGTQALAVTVRRLALGLIPPQLFLRVVGKEVLVGMTNGLAIGVVVGGGRRADGRAGRCSGSSCSSPWRATCSWPGSPARSFPIVLERLRGRSRDRLLDLRHHLHRRLRLPAAAGPGGMAAALTAR